MSSMKTHVERFDEAFKMLLIVMTISLSFSIALYKEIMDLKFFAYSVGTFIGAITLWIVPTLSGGKYEYLLKVGGWWFLMAAFETLYLRLYFTMFVLPPLMVSIIILLDLALTLPILKYLKENIGEKDYKDFRISLLVMTLLLVTFDVLYYLKRVTFPL